MMGELVETLPDDLLAWLERYQCATRLTRSSAVSRLLRHALYDWETESYYAPERSTVPKKSFDELVGMLRGCNVD